MDVTGESGDEGGHVLAALDRRKLRSALSIPAATHRLTIFPSRQRFTLLAAERAMEMVHLRRVTEDLAHAGGEGLGPVDDEQDAA